MSQAMNLIFAALIVANILGCLWLIRATSRRRPGEVPDGEVQEHVWDEDLREYNNPLPRWWLNLFVISVIFGIGYLVWYPGLLGYDGKSAWSSAAEMQDRLAEYHARRAQTYAAFAGQPLEALVEDATARRAGEALFGNYCAGCHGAEGRGAKGYPNLTDADWLYGGTLEAIRTTITQGRRGTMPAFNGQIDREAFEALLSFVSRWPANPADERHAAGRKVFQARCAACHGADGRGNPVLGAPNLTDDIWLHGGDRESIRHTILFGRSSSMPAFGVMLDPTEIDVLAAYVYGLGRR